MKEQIRTLLLQNPDITLPEAARTLGKDPQNNKTFGLAYWQARTLLMEELTGQTIRTLLENTDRKDLIMKDSNTDRIGTIDTDRIDNEGHINNMDHTSEGPFDHSVSSASDHTVSFNESTSTDVSSEDMDHIFGDFDISDF